MKVDPHILTIVFAVVGLLLLLIIARTARRWNAAPVSADSFDFHDLVMENGKASKGAVVMMGSFAATTWFFIYYAVAGKMTEGYFGLYAGVWIAPVVARMITNAPTPPTAEAKATTTTTTTLSQASPSAIPSGVT